MSSLGGQDATSRTKPSCKKVWSLFLNVYKHFDNSKIEENALNQGDLDSFCALTQIHLELSINSLLKKAISIKQGIN
jgi:hypothetical protein